MHDKVGYITWLPHSLAGCRFLRLYWMSPGAFVELIMAGDGQDNSDVNSMTPV